MWPRARARYGDVFRTHLIGAKTIVLTGEDALAWIFAGEGKYLQNTWNTSTRRLLGEECTAMLVGPAHAERRALLMPHFRHSTMRAFAPQMQAISTRHFERWTKTGDVTVLPSMQALVFEIIVTLLLGDGAGVDIPYLSRLFRAWTAGIATLPLDLPFTTYHRALKAKGELLAAIDTIVQERRRLPEQPNDILGSLLSVRDEQGKPLKQEAIVHELHNQLFAGHDTTVTVMTNLMLQLAQHPAVLAPGTNRRCRRRAWPAHWTWSRSSGCRTWRRCCTKACAISRPWRGRFAACSATWSTRGTASHAGGRCGWRLRGRIRTSGSGMGHSSLTPSAGCRP